MSYQNDFIDRVENGGNLKISEEAIASITAIASKEVEGVAELATVPANIKGVLKSKPMKTSVKVDLNDGVAIIDVYVKVKYGSKVQTVAADIQKKVKDSVQNMTSVAVSKVNVHIASLSFEDRK